MKVYSMKFSTCGIMSELNFWKILVRFYSIFPFQSFVLSMFNLCMCVYAHTFYIYVYMCIYIYMYMTQSNKITCYHSV
jgi:hypothetical protein